MALGVHSHSVHHVEPTSSTILRRRRRKEDVHLPLGHQTPASLPSMRVKTISRVSMKKLLITHQIYERGNLDILWLKIILNTIGACNMF